MSLTCETCRTQARTVFRAAIRAGASRAAAAAPRTNFITPARTPASVPVRQFSKTSERSLLKGLGSAMAEPYRVLGATEQLFKASSKAADYHITEKERKNDQVQLAEDGEEIGHSLNPDSVWHHSTSVIFPNSCFWFAKRLQPSNFLPHLAHGPTSPCFTSTSSTPGYAASSESPSIIGSISLQTTSFSSARRRCTSIITLRRVPCDSVTSRIFSCSGGVSCWRMMRV